MSKHKSQGLDELPLFDLPLHANDEAQEPAVADRDEAAGEPFQGPPEGRPEALTLFPLAKDPVEAPARSRSRKRAAPIEPEAPPTAADEAEPEVMAEDEDDGSELAPLGPRFVAGGLDFGIQVLVLGAMVAAVSTLGIRVTFDLWMPFALLALVFSFLYWFIPLAFWGQTPGMAWVGSTAVGLGDEPLTFAQTALRWCGALLTLALAGLPLLLALGGRSLTDRLSESKTVTF